MEEATEMKYFATFGSAQLKDFDLPQAALNTLITVKGFSEEELRACLLSSPIKNEFCTTYCADRLPEFINRGCKLYSLDEIMKTWKHKKYSLEEMRGY